MSVTVEIKYGAQTLASGIKTDSAVIQYGAQTLATLSAAGQKTLLCAGKLMTADLVIAGKTLLCAGKKMSDNIVVAAANSELYLVENYIEKVSFAGVGRLYSGSTWYPRAATKSGDTWTVPIVNGSPTGGAIHLAEAMSLADFSELHYEIEIKHANYPNGVYKFYIENWSTQSGTAADGLYIAAAKDAEAELIAGKNDFVLNSGVLTLPSGTARNDICLGCYASYNNISCRIKNLWLT